MNKQYEVVIREPDGTFLTRLSARLPLVPPASRKTIRNFDPKIVSEINQGQGALNIDIDTLFDDFGEGVDIANGNIVQVYLFDENHPSPDGVLIYAGHIVRYTAYLEGQNQGVTIEAHGIVAQLHADYFIDPLGPGYEFNVQDTASEIFKFIIDTFRAVYTGSSINYDGSSVEDSLVTQDKDYSFATWLDAIKQTLQIAPAGWWWRIEPSGLAVFKSKPSTATHIFDLQKHVTRITVPVSSENIKNRVRLDSSAASTPHIVTDSASIATYGQRTIRFNDTTIQDDTTADVLVAKELAERKDEKRGVVLTINDLYDLESIKPGDTCTILGSRIGSTLLPANLQIVKVEYSSVSVTLTLEEDYQNFTKQLAKFNQ